MSRRVLTKSVRASLFVFHISTCSLLLCAAAQAEGMLNELSSLGGEVLAIDMSNELLLIGEGENVSIYALSSENGLDRLALIPLDSLVTAVFIDGPRAFLGRMEGIDVYDISNPESPTSLGHVPLSMHERPLHLVQYSDYEEDAEEVRKHSGD